ncbi:hypothetical protein AGABI2DRAFT_151828 [Agaricus bisporus var. bisporus H97]|uniref:hypothetical protein n=1 Tax=Agaricus bisporus var. bisporus (strain H97 / ATCC MYA-4626 / FGSC 10389) TaxID=936046 RepID=UPI00029F5C91|nr:hypothetical protein AGABI2DRAFT_151828 [Agaricus bisporus var. bisporus H97]EKV45512.1 hypothetical protein AGABI2DRAFT_151828 [Agaricus bisporus var. bisporus H97]
MSANAIMFQNPTPEIFDVLPPSREKLNEVLAYVFVGHAKPTLDDFKRTPMLVRRQKVRLALQWLKINHSDYSDLVISESNLSAYPDEGLPVMVEHCPIDGSINPLVVPLSGEDEDDVEECRFAVHGLTGQEFSQLSVQALKARALQHLREGGSVLGIGHPEQPLSIFNNPQLYPQMFPCLFPFGYSGLGNCRMCVRLSDATHKKWLMNLTINVSRKTYIFL